MLNENQIFWSNLEKLKDSLLLDDLEFAGTLGLSYEEYLKCRKNAYFLPLNCVFEFAEKMNFHFEDLLKEEFKLNIEKSSGHVILSDRYTYATYSEIQPLRNIISYLEMVRGMRAKINLIRKFNLTEDFFNNEQQRVNIHLISDIVRHLSLTYKFTDKEFKAMGHQTPFVVKSDFLKNKLTVPKNVEDVVSTFFEECTHLFDMNYHYKINSMVDNHVIIDATPRKHVLDELKIDRSEFGNREACYTRMGVISSMTYFKYGLNAPITQIASLQNGDTANRYLMDMTPFKKLGRSSSRNKVSNTHPIYQ